MKKVIIGAAVLVAGFAVLHRFAPAIHQRAMDKCHQMMSKCGEMFAQQAAHPADTGCMSTAIPGQSRQRPASPSQHKPPGRADHQQARGTRLGRTVGRHWPYRRSARTAGDIPGKETARTKVMTMMWFGGGMMVLFWAVVLFGIVALIRYAGWGGQRWGGQRGGESPEPPAPDRLLAERFARGEIDEDEYRQRLAVLQAAGHTQASADGQARPPAGTGTR